MYKYEIIIYWSNEDNSYIAEVPELAGCMADGETMQKALETAKKIGKNIPEPKGKLAFA